MSSDRTCTICGGPLPDDIPEGAPCPECAQATAARTVIEARTVIIESAPASSPIPAQIRQTVGDYEVLDKLGQGGMGAVYRARQISLDRIVALKVLPAQYGDDSDYIGRFQREARVASGLRHPNLVGVYACGSADGCHFIAMELIEGENLHQRLRQGRMDIAEALSVTDHVARGLQCGWETAQVVHRDIKPSNIYLSHEGDVKVGDLGLAKSLSSNTTGLTQTGSMMGTPHYMSPEQCRGDKVIDFRADIYSLGCTLFEMLTGHPPYSGKDPIAIVRQHLDAPPAGLLKAMPDCPLPLALLVGRMLKKAPRERHASYGELIAEIESLYHRVEGGTLVPAAGFGAAGKTPTAKITRESPNWIPSAIMGVIIIALCVIFIPNWKTKPPVPEEDADILATPKPRPQPAATPAPQVAAAKPTPAPAIAPAVASFGPWQPLFTDAEWKETVPGQREVVDGRMHLQKDVRVLKAQPVADGAIRARIRFREGSKTLGIQARSATTDNRKYKIEVGQTYAELYCYTPKGFHLGRYTLPKPLQPGDTVLVELRLQGDRVTALLDGAVVLEARDSRVTDPGQWGILADDGWFESVEVQTPLPAAASTSSPDGWEDLRTPLTPDVLAKIGNGWRREGEALRSPNSGFARLPLGTPSASSSGPRGFAGASYQVHARLQQTIAKNGFAIVLPVGDRRVLFVLDGEPPQGYFTGLDRVNGKRGKDLPGTLLGRQVTDSESHELDVTVRLDGVNATITATLDARPLYAWAGPIATLSIPWPEMKGSLDALALLSFADDWLVLEVKAKRLGEGASADAATKDAPFENSFGMKFVPVPIVGGPTAGKTVLFSVWETRVQDYETFATETKREWRKPRFEQGPTHPAVGVTWSDATAFCAWLTERERKAGRIGGSDAYRLPSDHEWSCAAGLGEREDAAKTPEEKNAGLPDVYAWGSAWPPPPGAGNFNGMETEGKAIKFVEAPLKEYRDDFPTTAPVGSFPPNRWGLYDLSGNVWEKCEDLFRPGDTGRVVRGGAFSDQTAAKLKLSCRLDRPEDHRTDFMGFRCVLAVGALAAAAPAPDGWQDLRTPLTPDVLEKTGGGWRREGQALRSPNYVLGRLPLGTFAGASYQVSVKLRQLVAKDGFSLLLPVGDRSVAFALDGLPAEGYFTGLNQVDGKRGKELPGSVLGRQVKDAEPHELDVTVRLDGPNATIASTLDARPLYAWTGPIAALSLRWPDLQKTADTLALLTFANDWLVLEVKAKRLAP